MNSLNDIYSDLVAIAGLTGCSGDEKISLDTAAFNYLCVCVGALINWMSTFIYIIIPVEEYVCQ